MIPQPIKNLDRRHAGKVGQFFGFHRGIVFGSKTSAIFRPFVVAEGLRRIVTGRENGTQTWVRGEIPAIQFSGRRSVAMNFCHRLAIALENDSFALFLHRFYKSGKATFGFVHMDGDHR